MPTVYTQKIDDGTLTNGKDFIKLCLNAFGIMIHNKDNAPTTERTDFNKVYASDIEYYTKQIAQAKEKLSKAEEDFKVKTPLEICMQFFVEMQGREMTEEEEAIVKEVLNEGGLES